MGHAHISTTLLYVHHNVADLVAKHNAASPLHSVTGLVPNKPRRRRLAV